MTNGPANFRKNTKSPTAFPITVSDGPTKMTRLLFISLLILFVCVLTHLPVILSQQPDYRHKAEFLVASSYLLGFRIFGSVQQMRFNYTLNMKVRFNLTYSSNMLVFECTAAYVHITSVNRREGTNRIQLGVEVSRVKDYVVVHQRSNEKFQEGHYEANAIIKNKIGSKHGKGIQYSLFIDSQTKNL